MSMVCKCGEKASCIDSRQVVDSEGIYTQQVRRRYRCDFCETRWTTYEQEGKPVNMDKLREQLVAEMFAKFSLIMAAK